MSIRKSFIPSFSCLASMFFIVSNKIFAEKLATNRPRSSLFSLMSGVAYLRTALCGSSITPRSTFKFSSDI